MHKRFVTLWFPHLLTDWMERHQTELKQREFVLYAPERGRMIVQAVSQAAAAKGIRRGSAVADCRAIFPQLRALEYPVGKAETLLEALALWCLRYTPVVGVDLPDGLVLDCSGCTHLWGGETAYLNDIVRRLQQFGYAVRAAMADTFAAAWAVSRYGKHATKVALGESLPAVMTLPPEALRLEPKLVSHLRKVGFERIGQFAHLPRVALRKRFGTHVLLRLDQVAGLEPESFVPVQPPKRYVVQLPCLEPVRTPKAIEWGMERLLELLCTSLEQEGKGLRIATLRGYRVDGDVQQLRIGTHLPSRHVPHLLKLFTLKLDQFEPDLGFESFELEANTVEPVVFDQTAIWVETHAVDTKAVAELLDKFISKHGTTVVHRYLPEEHYWPERSYQLARSLQDLKTTAWRTDQPRPIHVLKIPHVIDVTVPLPDYPPMLFFYKGHRHHIVKADGPERMEQEWWIEQGEFRDYYCVEDTAGKRYWIFRSGHMDSGRSRWYVHGFFA